MQSAYKGSHKHSINVNSLFIIIQKVYIEYLLCAALEISILISQYHCPLGVDNL